MGWAGWAAVRPSWVGTIWQRGCATIVLGCSYDGIHGRRAMAEAGLGADRGHNPTNSGIHHRGEVTEVQVARACMGA